MEDIVKITPSSRILPKMPQDPHPEKERSGDQDETLQDDSERDLRDQTPEEREGEKKDDGIDVYV